MSDELDLDNYQIRTDLALEAHEQKVAENQPEDEGNPVDGVVVKEENLEGVKLTTVRISEKGADQLGKKPGRY